MQSSDFSKKIPVLAGNSIELSHTKVTLSTLPKPEGGIEIIFDKYCGTAVITTRIKISDESANALQKLLIHYLVTERDEIHYFAKVENPEK